MARIPISEYRAKSLLLGSSYRGLSFRVKNSSARFSKLDPKGRYVLKVDQGIKKRHKQGLLAVDINPGAAPEYIKKFQAKGYEQYLIEPFLPHAAKDEKYLAVERLREGLQILYSRQGGVDIEDTGAVVEKVLYKGGPGELKKVAAALGLKAEFLETLTQRFNQLHMTFVEINPLVVQAGKPLLLDCAAQVDSAAAYFTDEWTLDDDTSSLNLSPAEKAVAELEANSASSFSLKLVNPDGALGMLLSGGGASVAIADEVCNLGQADNLLNYGEYSGNPTAEETKLYAIQVLNLLLASQAKTKALVIAGGVANFTDIKQTFKGVIQALGSKKKQLQQQRVKVFVRRGGPNEVEGLAMMRGFLEMNDLLGEVSGSDVILTKAVASAVEYVA
ncbi:hypothetical protein HYW35_01025 [Candidatus Saccharibacteria bacterium]|nr:hypothetical protein [Candidatus Saccharibacteria bacterium]